MTTPGDGVLEIVPGIHWIPHINGNCYLLADTPLTLIDTGLPHNTKKILTYITDTLHRKPQDLTAIILTHYHVDHIGNAAELREKTGAKVAALAEEAPYIEGTTPTPAPRSMLMKVVSPLMRPRPCPVDVRLRDHETINGCLVIHTPGHTPGSIALFRQPERALFSGDTILAPGGSVKGPSEHYTLDYQQALLSVKRLKELDFDVLLPGHGSPIPSEAAVKVRSALP
jgi:hydroxyacylglutathione hydrolase